MRAKSKRHTRQEICRGQATLPPSLRFLAEERDYAAIVQQTKSGRGSWVVEIKPRDLKKLFDERACARRAGQVEAKLKVEVEDLQRALARKEDELQKVKDEGAVLQHNLDVLSGHKKVGPTPARSFSKNFFQHAADTGMNLRQRPLEGGLPGLPRRR